MRGRATTWTDEHLTERLQDFLGERLDWPSRAMFVAAGEYALWMAVRDHGGHLFWADRLGKTLSSAQQPRHVPEAELLAQARDIIARRGRLPNQEQLRLDGYPRLATAVQAAGGARKFQAKHGI